VGLNNSIRALAAEDDLVAVADVNGYLWMTGQQADASFYSHDCTHPSGVHGPIDVTIPQVPVPMPDGSVVVMDLPVTIPADDVGAGSTLHLQMFGYALQGLFQ
jgi:hypothetical protein